MNRFVYLGLGVLAVVLIWSGAWFYFAGQVRGEVESLAQADGVTSPRLVCGGLDVSGFPFRFDVACREAEIVSGDVTVSVPEIRASALMYNPTHIVASARGPAAISNAFTGARNSLAWGTLDGSVRLTDWRIGRLSLVADDLTWTDTLVGEMLIAESPHAEFHLIDMPELYDAETRTAALAGYATAEQVNAPGLGVTSGDIALETELTGLPADLALLGAPGALQRWQQAGGQLNIVSLSGTDGENFVSASGQLALNDAGQLDGQLKVNSKGIVERLAGLIPQQYQGLLLGEPADDGSYSNTITFAGGVVMAGLIPAAMIPPLF
jgi:hypothetical protein